MNGCTTVIGLLLVLFSCTGFAQFTQCDDILQKHCIFVPIETTTDFSVTCDIVITDGEPFLPCFNSSVIDLSILSSDITILQGSDFVNLTRLALFLIQGSPLMNVTEDAFSLTPLLEELTIQNTNLSELAEATFLNNTQLTVLNLDDNQLTLSTNWLENATSVERLSLSNNDISTVPGGFFPADSIIKELNLAGNKLTYIDKDTFSVLDILEHLDLSQNVIQDMDSASLHNLTALKTLSLADNVLTGLPMKLFTFNTVLQQLNISMNQMDSAQAIAFDGNDQLQILDASDNLIYKVSTNAFADTPGITGLSLRNNILVELEDNAFSNLTDLKLLDLSMNPLLTEFNPNALPIDLFDLETIHLQDCGLTSLDMEAFIGLSNLQNVYAHGNPIFCNCDVSWISENAANPPAWMTPWLGGETAVLCETPDNFNGSIVAEVDPELLTCELPVINHQDEYSETNGNDYYYVVMLSNGLPSSNYTLPNGKVLAHGDSYDPGTGKDFVAVEEFRTTNNSIRSTLSISKTTKASEGNYLFRASNAGGDISMTFDLTIDDKVTNKGKVIGGIVGGILGVILVVVIFGVVVDLVKNKRDQQTYRCMRDEGSVNTVSHGGGESPRGGESQGGESRGQERSPFAADNAGAAPYGGVDDVAPPKAASTTTETVNA